MLEGSLGLVTQANQWGLSVFLKLQLNYFLMSGQHVNISISAHTSYIQVCVYTYIHTYLSIPILCIHDI